jgi:hypothetical protein
LHRLAQVGLAECLRRAARECQVLRAWEAGEWVVVRAPGAPVPEGVARPPERD